MLELKHFISKILKPSKNFMTYPELNYCIYDKYKYNVGKHMLAKIIRNYTNMQQVVVKYKKKTTRGLYVDVIDIDLSTIIIDKNKEFDDMSIDEQRSFIDNTQLRINEENRLHRIVRFIIKDWEELHIILQLKYKKHKVLYFNEKISGIKHNTAWFKDIIKDSGYPDPADLLDYEIITSKEVLLLLQAAGKTKASRMTWDRLENKAKEIGYTMLGDNIYGKKIIAPKKWVKKQ